MPSPKLKKLKQYIWTIFKIIYIKDMHIHHMNTKLIQYLVKNV
jgi:hypothetical protein